MGKSGKNNPDSDWDFKVDDEDLEEVRVKKPKKKISGGTSAALLKKKGTGTPKKKKSLTIEGPRKKKKMSRSAIAKRDAALKQYSELMPPSTTARLIATFIDYALIGIIFAVAIVLTPTLNYHYVSLLRDNGMSQTMDPEQLNLIIQIAFTGVVSLLLIFFPAMMFFKTPGKGMMKMRIGHPVVGERPGKVKAFLREVFFKPLSIISIIGILIGLKNDGNRCVHDFICKTALYIDD